MNYQCRCGVKLRPFYVQDGAGKLREIYAKSDVEAVKIVSARFLPVHDYIEETAHALERHTGRCVELRDGLE
jgi:hypothetical protein